AWTAPSPGLIHVMGGTVMGKSAKDSVCDSYGRTHDVRNLVLAGTGVNPTEGGVHPTFTMHTLALRTSEHMLGNWRGYA
ncbi:MAG TPA: GMC oxidoreductase, partial [Stellaceae bacterium]|nr:GMC oxidoreductase [Stellaceae bacterium]